MSKFYLKFLDYDLYLVVIYKFKENFYNLMNMVMIDNKFCSFTKTDNEISLIIDKKSYDKHLLMFGFNKLSIIYKVFQFYEEGSGVQHVGIVNEISSLFKTYTIPILYINSYNNNYVLIEKKDFKKTLKILKNNDYNIIYE